MHTARRTWQAVTPLLVLMLMLACAAWPGGSASAATPVPLQIKTERLAPASMEINGVVSGRETSKIRELMARTATAYTIELLPWKRAYLGAMENDNTCVYSTTRTPEREARFKWVGPTDEAEWQFWGRADRNFALRTLEDARKLRIGTYNGDAREEFLRARGFTVESVDNDLLNPEKLLLNRIDLWAVAVRRGASIPRNPQWDGKVVPLLVFHRVKVYLACNRSVPDVLVDKLNQAVNGMWRDGTMERLNRQYDNWKAPQH